MTRLLFTPAFLAIVAVMALLVSADQDFLVDDSGMLWASQISNNQWIRYYFMLAELSLVGEGFIDGGNPCTWGPAFWCSSRENAQQCGDSVGVFILFLQHS